MNKKAFTLLELMIVCSIIGIMTAAIIVSLINSQIKKEVEIEARIVAAAIREAQNYALTGKTTQAGDLPCKYRFTSNSGDGSYKIRYYYHTNANSDCGNERIYAVYSLKNKVSFAASRDFYFTVPHGIPSPSPFSTVTVTVRKSTSVYNICVYPSGLVKEKGTGGC